MIACIYIFFFKYLCSFIIWEVNKNKHIYNAYWTKQLLGLTHYSHIQQEMMILECNHKNFIKDVLHVGPLELSHFESAILGSGHTFSTTNDFQDVVYLMSIGGLFRYKFKRDFPKHMIVICVVEGCPWKVTTHVVGRTKIVQVHTFRNQHNHLITTQKEHILYNNSYEVHIF